MQHKPKLSVRNFCRGLLCTADLAGARAGGVEASSSGKHSGQVATLHHRQLAVHVGKAGVTLVPGSGKGGVGGSAWELLRSGAKAPQYFKRDCAKRISRACMVGVVVPTLVSVPQSSRVARGARGGAEVRSSEGMDENDTSPSTCPGPGRKLQCDHRGSSFLKCKQDTRIVKENKSGTTPSLSGVAWSGRSLP
jgi:hypothetical protein